MVSSKDLCKGCVLYDSCIIRTSTNEKKQSQVQHCPCTICLVKVTCNESISCKSYVKWLRNSNIRY